MRLLYNAALRIYKTGIWCASFFNPKAKKWIVGRKTSFESLKNFSTKNPLNIWLHCASVGEFEQGFPLLSKLKKEYPHHKILLSFYSPSGYEYAKNKYPELDIIYLPLDTKNNASKWYSILKPKAVFFIKYEFWHHYIQEAKNSKIPLYIVSAVFWKDLFIFKKTANFFRKSLKNVSHFFVQNEESKTLLNEIGIQQATLIGDTRYERVIQLKNSKFQDTIIEKFINQNKVFIAGSVWNSDSKSLIKIIQSLPQDFKIIVAPHEIENFDYQQYDDFTNFKYSASYQDNSKILFVNTIGILSRIYKYASITYVGGGFGSGIHNVLEPAVYNIPVLVGPNFEQFIEAKALKDNGMLYVIENNEKTEETIAKALSLNERTKELNNDFFARNANVSEQILVFIKKHGILD